MYKIFLDNVNFIQQIINQRHSISDAVSYIDYDFWSKVSNLSDVNFIGAVFEHFNDLLEKIDFTFKVLKKEIETYLC
jgi:hypothetical protein